MKTQNCVVWGSTIELLESRIAPASFSLDHKTAYFIDVDGDLVTVKTTLGTFDNANFALVDPGGPVTGGVHFSQLMLNDAEFAGAKITVTAKRGPAGGDGMVNLGLLDTRGVDIAGFNLKGDLGRIEAGDANLATPAIGTLSVASMGLLFTSTQLGPEPASMDSHVAGGMTTLAVGSNMRGPTIYTDTIDTMRVGDNLEYTTLVLTGALDTLVVGGNATELNLTAAGADTMRVGGYMLTSNLNFSGPLTTLRVGTNLWATQIAATGIGTITIGGSVLNANFTAEDHVSMMPADFTALRVGGNFKNSSVFASGDLGTIVPGARPGLYVLTGGVKVNGTMETSQLYAGGDMASVVIGGDMNNSSLSASNIGLIGAGAVAGNVKLIGGVTVRGSVENLNLWTSQTLSSLRVGADWEGGSLFCFGDVGQIRVGQSLEVVNIQVGHEMYMMPPEHVALADAGTPDFGMPANLTQLAVGGDMTQVSVFVTGDVGMVTAGTTPGTYKLSGGIGVRGTVSNGYFNVFGDLANLNVGGDMEGGYLTAASIGNIGPGVAPGSVKLTGLANIKGWLTGTQISVLGSVTALNVGGNMTGGNVNVGDDIGAITPGRTADTYVLNGGVTVRGAMLGSVLEVKGDLAALKVGRDLDMTNVRVRGDRDPVDLLTAQTIGGVTVGGRVRESLIYAGYDFEAFTNGDVQIGKVTVAGDWIASNLVAGVDAGWDGQFGNDSDLILGYANPIVSRIAAVTINGHAFGNTDPGNHFGIVAEEIVAFKSAGAKLPLTPGAANDLIGFNVGPTFDFTVREPIVV